MNEAEMDGPSLIKLGKLANGRQFGKLEELWPAALESDAYSWRELAPIAGQVGRQGAAAQAEALIGTLLARVEETAAPEILDAARLAAAQLPGAQGLRDVIRQAYAGSREDDLDWPALLDLLFAAERPLDQAAALADRYRELRPGDYAVDRSFLVPGVVETVRAENGVVTVIFGDRRGEYGPGTIEKLSPRPADHFPALVLYDPERLRSLAGEDPVAFVHLALESTRDGRFSYRDLKGSITELLGEKGWKAWWPEAKAAFKRDPLLGLSSGTQPVIRKLRQADRYEDRLRREFDFQTDALRKLQKILDYLDEIVREEKQGACDDCADEDLLVHFGNGAAKIAMASLASRPDLALAGLALHAEIAGRGVATARSNPRAAGQVLGRIEDPATLVDTLPDALVQRALFYLRASLPDSWGEVWSAVLARSGRRLCETIGRGLIEGDQRAALESALLRAVARPSSSPDLLCWAWRTRFTAGATGRFLAGLDKPTVSELADAMFALLDSTGRLYGLSMDEKHLKLLENARSALAVQGSEHLLRLLDTADRGDAIRLMGIIKANAGLAAAHRTQLLGYLRSRWADIFVDEAREWADGAITYTTEDGLRRQQAALQHIIEVQIPEVATQIGEAASHGDLSENAEYTAALEKRDQLAITATRMEGELALAQVIPPDLMHGNTVNVGTRVTAQPQDGASVETYTFLGPWDTDVENRVLNYQAPLAQAFMGARVGDRVTYDTGEAVRTWEIVAIEPAY